MKKAIVKTAALSAILIAAVTGCKQDVTYTIQPSEVITDTVSFSKNLQPIFTSKCALSGCHVSGGQVPDLETGVAFSSLKSANLYDTSSPKNSILYGRLIGTLTPAMPIGGSSNPDNVDALVLAWITQGAKNN